MKFLAGDNLGVSKTKQRKTIQQNNIISKNNKLVDISISGGIINKQVFSQFITGLGSIIANENFLSLDILNGVGDYSILRTKKVISNKSGNISYADITSKFSDNGSNMFEPDVNNSLSFVGLGNAQCDLYFCYQNGDFGIRRSTGGLIEVRLLTITGASTGIETATITLNGVPYNVNLTNAGGSINFTAHQIEIGSYGSGWFTEHIGAEVYFIGSGVGSLPGVYSFTSATATGMFTTIKIGAPLTTTFIKKSNWNEDKIIFNPTDWNRYKIEFDEGVGVAKFYIYDKGSYDFKNVHTVNTSGTGELLLSSPNVYIQTGVASLGSIIPMGLNVSSINGGYIDGNYNILDSTNPLYYVSNERSIIGGIESNILVISNRRIINGFSNQQEIYAVNVNVAVDGSKPVIIKYYKNPTTIGANIPSDYTDFKYVDEAESPILFDTKSLTFSGGDVIETLVVGINESVSIKKIPLIKLAREDVLIITAKSSTNNNVFINLELIQA